MRILMIFFYLLLIVLGVSFAALNAGSAVVDLYVKTITLPVSVIIVISFGLGLLLGFFMSLLRRFRLKIEATKLKSHLKLCEQEIKNLRDIPLKDTH